MVPQTPTPSARLLRAAAAERAELARHRTRLLAARASLREELERIEASLGEVDDRDALLARLTPAAGGVPAAAGVPAAGGVLAADARGDAGAEDGGHGGATAAATILRGPAIRRAAVRVLLEAPERPEALHYRRWYALLGEAGYAVAGKDPLAVFLTQLSRSPVVTRGTQHGVYAIDRDAPRRLRARLAELHAGLRTLASAPGTAAASDLAAIRERRSQITAETARVERALEEAETLLAPPRPVRSATA